MRRLVRGIGDDLRALNPSVVGLHLLTWFLPDYVGARLRSRVMRAMGFQVGPDAAIWATPRVHGVRNLTELLRIGANLAMNVGCRLDINDRIDIGDNVAIGHDVLILTGTHRLGPPDRRCGPDITGPVTIGDGVWIGARSVILPAVTIGAGAVVSAGSVVNKDVPANSVVAGVPARVVVPRLPGAGSARREAAR